VTLRRVVLCLGVLALVAGVVLVVQGGVAIGGFQLIVLGVAVLLGVILEARRYRGRSGPGRWQPTTERFVDPTTGRLMEVQYDADTGERRYVDAGPGPS
jgi:predicted membrane metal-binding protein